MEKTVMELESGNYEADDSEGKHRYDNQRQLNMQLQVIWYLNPRIRVILKITNIRFSLQLTSSKYFISFCAIITKLKILFTIGFVASS